MEDLASSVKTITGLQAQLFSGETAVYGPKIDRLGYDAAVFSLQTGTPSGSPSVVGVTAKLQTMSGETDWVDISGASTIISGESIPHQHEINQDLKSQSRYIRMVATPHFTGGSSPKIEAAATCVLGEPRIMPV